jgi:four helix bundle protein
VYQQSYVAALEVSRITKAFPCFEQLELGRQLRRSARSVPANIVEGWAKRSSPAEFKRYLQNALGSCAETKLWLEMAKDEGYLSLEKYKEMDTRYGEIAAKLTKLWKQWRTFVR